ncbi:LysR family transcriptional regulator [Alicyclobacillus fastidiosus]|uniref:LysR family transcriptional regulator n=1 Tax=Alicyclobacillus fastidiosus TaxID=392011 RepID=A0ABV5ADQ5_9BACL|nr:LysR family transcriptional regulator [Alicyclobacillus fastidiosus]WEH08678.1 LysR family transcriptional regulator [Alicyclobacillus fastidiosus]
MDTKDLQLFLAASRNKSISRTAEQLFMSQSTVTTRLQRLERDIGYQLFARMPNGVQLTSEGARFLPLAEQIVSLERQMSEPSQLPKRTLRVMSGRAFVSTDVPMCLHRIVELQDVRLQVRMGLYENMVDALINGQVDFCFLGEPVYHPRVRLVEFPDDAIDLVIPANHPFAHDFPGIRAIATEPFIAFSDSTAPFRKRVTMLLAKHDLFPEVRMELDSIDGIKAMVAQGLGVSLLPRRTLVDASSKGYVAIPIADEAFRRPTLLAYPDSLEDEPLTKQFIEVVSEHYQHQARFHHDPSV